MNMKRGRNLRNAKGGQARWDSKSGTETAGKRVHLRMTCHQVPFVRFYVPYIIFIWRLSPYGL